MWGGRSTSFWLATTDLRKITDDDGVVIDDIASHYWKKVISDQRRIKVNSPHKNRISCFIYHLDGIFSPTANCAIPKMVWTRSHLCSRTLSP